MTTLAALYTDEDMSVLANWREAPRSIACDERRDESPAS